MGDFAKTQALIKVFITVYFFACNLTNYFRFAYFAKALIVFPGGFDTLDEMMEIITLIQSGKIKKEVKVIVYDEKYWEEIITFDVLVKYERVCKKRLEAI